MLEDDYSDVLRKAMLGHGLDDVGLAGRLGISRDDWQRFIGGEFSDAIARACAEALGLDAGAVAAHPSYHPQPIELAGLQRLVLPFGAYEVNAWWLSDGSTNVLFDLGFEARDLIDRLPEKPDAVFITHGHRDHIGALDWALGEGIPVFSPDERSGVEKIAAGATWEFGSLRIRSEDLSGHCNPQLGFFIEGLERQLLVVGDALFAGSIGRCASPGIFRHALKRLHDVLDPMPDGLVLLPGHGPATTLGEERRSNPFL